MKVFEKIMMENCGSFILELFCQKEDKIDLENVYQWVDPLKGIFQPSGDFLFE
jgi:hypothetical protein